MIMVGWSLMTDNMSMCLSGQVGWLTKLSKRGNLLKRYSGDEGGGTFWYREETMEQIPVGNSREF